MHIHRSSLVISILLHGLFILLFILLYKPPLPELLIKPLNERVVTLTLKSREKPVIEPPRAREIIPPVERTIPKEKALSVPPPAKPITEKAPPVVPLPVVESPEPTENGVNEQVEQPRVSAVNPEKSYIYSSSPSYVDEVAPVLPTDDPLLDDLLFSEEPKESFDERSYFTFEIQGDQSRKILDQPEIIFDSNDPELSLLESCRVSFLITEQGLVRDISMIEPGTGSPFYDRIIETLLSQFLFAPGRDDRGIIKVNFSSIGEDLID